MGTGLVTKLFNTRVGASLLSSHQVRSASIGNVMQLFSAHGTSEKERLEMGFYLQRMILEGHKSGVDLASMIKAKGGLNFGPLGDDLNGHSGRMQRFFTQATKQLVATSPQKYTDTGVKGDPRRNYNPAMFEDMEKKVSSASLGDSINNVFGLLKQYQDQVGLKDPNTTARGLLTPPTIGQFAAIPATTSQMQAKTTDAFANSMPRGVMDPQNAIQNLMGTQPQKGIASANPISLDASQPGTGRGQKVVVYNGADWTAEANDMAKQIRALGYQVDMVSNLSGVNYDQYAAVFMPGGNAGTEASAIGSRELARLSAAVNSGLNYFGSCAGAFLAGSYGSNSLGLVNKAFDYPTSSAFSQQKTVTHDTLMGGLAKAVGTNQADILQYGGPALGGVSGATVLATYPDGEASIIEAMHGKGQVILTGGHPAINPNEVGLRNVDDTKLFAALAKATIQGTDPGGTATPIGTDPNNPGPTTGGDTNNSTTNNITRIPAAIQPQQLGGGGGGGPAVRGAPNVALAGQLDQGIGSITSSFASALQGVSGSATGGALDQSGGTLARLKGL